MKEWQYKFTNRFHGTKKKDRMQSNYSPSPVYRFVWDKPKDEVKEETNG